MTNMNEAVQKSPSVTDGLERASDEQSKTGGVDHFWDVLGKWNCEHYKDSAVGWYACFVLSFRKTVLFVENIGHTFKPQLNSMSH